ncbi:hypothetical protein RGQ13_11750 [Thalassotalea psychrophila]|uniref:Lipoprotein n=1 Tax=Thalassotalea psychrophila TaxID=3065647 RepID=A0ABY9TST5_9GAMM|nr:hypothetical protein RGQ13_11750 [Colwelliaceae bacterium SQ149]
MKTPISLLLMNTLLILTLTSCVAEDEEEEECYQKTELDCHGVGGFGMLFAWLGGQCDEYEYTYCPDSQAEYQPVVEVFQSTKPTQPPQSDNPSNDTSSWQSHSIVETEPNNKIEQAYKFVLGKSTSLLISGTVNKNTDPTDFVVFSSNSTDLISIYLCKALNDCTHPFNQNNNIAIELIDQYGNSLEMTHFMQTQNGHEITFTANLNEYYFVAVRAMDVESDNDSNISYKLVITD